MAIHNLNNTTVIGSFIFNDTTMTVSHEGVAVKLDSTTPGAVVYCGAGEFPLGIIADTQIYTNGDPIGIAGIEGQIVDVYAGAAGFAAGDPLKVAASGYSVTAGTSDPYFAQAIDAATSGNFGRAVIKSGGSIVANATWTKSATNLQPTTAGDAITTAPAASTAKTISISTNTINGLGTDAAIDLALKPKGTGVVKMTNGSLTSIPLMPAWVFTQGTTGTVGTAGQIAAVGVTSAAVIIATLAEDPGADLAFSHVVAGTDLFTVYTANTNTDAKAALSGKKVNYIIVSY